MQFYNFVSATAVLFASAASAIEFTSFPPAQLTVGTPVNLTWDQATGGGAVTILLRAGPASNLQTVQTITSSATGNSFVWTPDTSIPDGASYALEILQGTEFNYTPQFSVTGGTAASVSSALSSMQASTSSAAGSSTATATSSSASMSITSSASTRSSSASGSSSASTTTSAKPTTSGATTAGNAANSNVQSPLALILGAVAAMMYFQ